ncbi:hypothetical protein B0H13DRAFT_1855945 [Mycena leptocephala]|nr:hypothetical protein B0H13DRAFT_1855945 [Mycena leptocephala]
MSRSGWSRAYYLAHINPSRDGCTVRVPPTQWAQRQVVFRCLPPFQLLLAVFPHKAAKADSRQCPPCTNFEQVVSNVPEVNGNTARSTYIERGKYFASTPEGAPLLPMWVNSGRNR